MGTETEGSVRSYGCSNGDGNPYDFVVVTVVDASTLFLCAPCFVHTAQEMLVAMLEPDNPDVIKKLTEAGGLDNVVPMAGRVRKRGHEAPAELDDEGVIEKFESFVLDDELPDGFR